MGILLVYSVTGDTFFRVFFFFDSRSFAHLYLLYVIREDAKSFENLRQFIRSIQENAASDVTMLLVGNNSDQVAERVGVSHININSIRLALTFWNIGD